MNNENNNIGSQIPNNNQNVNPLNPATSQFQTGINNGIQQNQAYGQFNSQTNMYQQTQSQMVNQNYQNASNKPKMNKNAIISIIFGAVSLFIFGWLAAVGVGLGIRSLSEIKKNNESGKALAIIGIIIGCASLGLYFYGIVMRNF